MSLTGFIMNFSCLKLSLIYIKLKFTLFKLNFACFKMNFTCLNSNGKRCSLTLPSQSADSFQPVS